MEAKISGAVAKKKWKLEKLRIGKLPRKGKGLQKKLIT